MSTNVFAAPGRLALAGIVSILVVACGTGSATPTLPPATVAPTTAAVAPTTAAAPSSATQGGAVAVNVANGILVGPTGNALYTKGTDPSSCTAGCLAAWPALVVPAGGTATAGTGVTGKVATVARPDGSTQVTYNGKPLYYFASDSAAGTATGDGVGGFSVAKP